VVSPSGEAFASGISPRQALDVPAVIYTLTMMVPLCVALLFVKPTPLVVRAELAG
jgi:hypothetical protein